MEEARDERRPCKSHPRASDPRGNVKQRRGNLSLAFQIHCSVVEGWDIGQAGVSLMDVSVRTEGESQILEKFKRENQ